MAIIDIDRHILREIAENSAAISRHIETLNKTYCQVVALHERNTALIQHLVEKVKEIDTGNGSEKRGKT